MNISNVAKGYKTYIAALGLLGLAIYQASTNDYTEAFQSLMAALAAAGLRSAIATTPTSASKSA